MKALTSKQGDKQMRHAPGRRVKKPLITGGKREREREEGGGLQLMLLQLFGFKPLMGHLMLR